MNSSSKKNADNWIQTLELSHVFPVIGDVPVNEIDPV